MHYIVLMNLTEQGARNAKDIPKRLADGAAAFEGMGGKVLSLHVTMGSYDYVAVGECPSDEVAAAFALSIASQGNVTTTTLKGFTPEEFANVVAAMP